MASVRCSSEICRGKPRNASRQRSAISSDQPSKCSSMRPARMSAVDASVASAASGETTLIWRAQPSAASREIPMCASARARSARSRSSWRRSSPARRSSLDSVCMARSRFSRRQLRLSELEHQRDFDARALLGRQVRRVRDGAVQERTRLAWRIPLEGVAGGDPEIPGGAHVIAGAVEMTRQVRGCLVLASGEHALHRESGTPVRRRARRRRHVIDDDLLVEPVRETIERAEDAVGELHHAFADDERPAAGEHLEHRLERELLHVRGMRRQPRARTRRRRRSPHRSPVVRQAPVPPVLARPCRPGWRGSPLRARLATLRDAIPRRGRRSVPCASDGRSP